jgi:hypothetical protein
MSTVVKSITTDFSGSLRSDRLYDEITASISNLDRIDTVDDAVSIVFSVAPSAGDLTQLDIIVAAHDGSTPDAKVLLETTGAIGTTVTIRAAPTGNNVVTLPDSNTVLLGEDTPQTLTNKMLDSATNTITADHMRCVGGKVSISSGPPTSGQVLKASSGAAASWQNSVNGPVSSLENELVRFSGTDGLTLVGTGVSHHGVLTADPSDPSPKAGDRYYNSVINHEMCYDAVRSKWLSVTTMTDCFGSNGHTSAGKFYKHSNNATMSVTKGPIFQKGTLISAGFTTSSSADHTIEMMVGGNVIAELLSAGAVSASSSSFNEDFDEGVFAGRNKSGSDKVKGMDAIICYKFRA